MTSTYRRLCPLITQTRLLEYDIVPGKDDSLEQTQKEGPQIRPPDVPDREKRKTPEWNNNEEKRCAASGRR